MTQDSSETIQFSHNLFHYAAPVLFLKEAAEIKDPTMNPGRSKSGHQFVTEQFRSATRWQQIAIRALHSTETSVRMVLLLTGLFIK